MSEMKERSWRRDERMTELFVKDARVRSRRRILIANLAFRKRGKRERERKMGWERQRETLSRSKAKMEKLLLLEDFPGTAKVDP